MKEAVLGPRTQRPMLAGPMRGSRVRRPASGASAQGLVLCLLIAIGGFGAAVAVTQLRLLDLIVSAVVLGLTLVLAVWDHRHLPTVIVGVWVFQPLVRRLVDWQAGGYTSLTILSLLPMLCTAMLIAPILARLHAMPKRLWLPLQLLIVPMVWSAAFGVFRYGASAIPDAGGLLFPLAFLPYFATRPMSGSLRFTILRAAVLICAISALYGWWQYLYLPTWDAMWLIQSGMTSSMGQAEVGKMRVWGTFNATGVAAVMWVLALLAAVADRRWTALIRWPAIFLLVTALMLTLARSAWMMLAAGLIAATLFSRGADRARSAFALVAVGCFVFLAICVLPGGDVVLNRAASFSDLSRDNSYNARVSILGAVVRQIMDEPWGAGLGFRSAGKISGSTSAITAIDNGYADLCLTFGIFGAILIVAGIGLLFKELLARSTSLRSPELASLQTYGLVTVTAIATGTLAILMIGGAGGMWLWLSVGLALSPGIGGRIGLSEAAAIGEQPAS